MLSKITSPKAKIVLSALVVVLVIFYGLVSFFIAQGVTKADRDPQEDHPSNYVVESYWESKF